MLEDSKSPPSEAWLFAQAILGKPLPNPAAAAAEARRKCEQLEFLASISDRHAAELRRLQSDEAEARRQRELLIWVAGISTRHEQQLRDLLASEAEARQAQRRYERFVVEQQLHEVIWDPSKHPRLGGPPNAGWWARTSGAGGSGGAGRHPGTLGHATDDSVDTSGQQRVPPRMLELASAWRRAKSKLDQYRRDIEELPARIANERAQLGRGGRYAYVHSQNLARAQKDLGIAKGQVPELEARLQELERDYEESGYDKITYGTTTPSETRVGGRGIERVGRALDMSGSPAGLKPTGIEFDIALGAGALRQVGKAALRKALPNAAEIPTSKAATLRPYGGVGGGHHIPAKSAFQGAAGYDAKTALAIPNEELAKHNIRHFAVTGAQKKLYVEFAKTGSKLTWEEVERIETEALVRGGLSHDVARATVRQAIDALKKAGISEPTRIPWGN
jgi:hypothetical protein